MTITKIVIHCSDTPDGRPDTAADIHRWHKEKGWDGIGYHYVIEVGGNTENGRPEYWTGAHASGHNTNSIGICLIGRGGYDDDQWFSLECLIHNLILKYPEAKVLGHNEISSKTCPNFDVQYWLKAKGLILCGQQ